MLMVYKGIELLHLVFLRPHPPSLNLPPEKETKGKILFILFYFK